MPLDPPHVFARLDYERQFVPLGNETLQRADPVVRMWSSDGTHHWIIWSRLDATNADAVIDREIAHHRALNVSFEWKVFSHDQPADLKERLVDRGFEVGAVEDVMVLDSDEARAWLDHDAFPPDVRVETVRSANQVQVFKRLAEAVFGGDWSFTAGELQSQIDRQEIGHRGYIAYQGDEPAAIGRLYVHPQSHFAGLYGGGTLPAFRGRGLYRATVHARIDDAVRFGARYLMVDARDTSRPILERLGFVSIGQTWPCVIE